MTKPKMIADIAEDLIPLAYPIEKLSLLPGNYNKGNIKAVAASLKQFKQRHSITARRDGEHEVVLAGNTTLLAARDELGWTHIAVAWADDLDEANAIGYAIADNETNRMGEEDLQAKAALIEQIQEDEQVLAATGLDGEAVERLLEQAVLAEQEEIESLSSTILDLDDDDEDDEPSTGPQRIPGNPVIQYAIIFDDEEQQQTWFRFVRWLKKTNPDADTVAERLSVFLEGIVPEDD